MQGSKEQLDMNAIHVCCWRISGGDPEQFKEIAKVGVDHVADQQDHRFRSGSVLSDALAMLLIECRRTQYCQTLPSASGMMSMAWMDWR
jgi:hypothetical protein